jgi:hypothetical protein
VSTDDAQPFTPAEVAEAQERHRLRSLITTNLPVLRHDADADLRRALATIAAAWKERDEVRYVPGYWRCPKCAFCLQQKNLNARDGSVTARDDPGDKCPNCDGPLWRVSWQEDARETGERLVAVFEEATELRARVAVLESATRPLVDRMARMLDADLCECEPEGHVCGKPDAQQEVTQARAALDGGGEVLSAEERKRIETFRMLRKKAGNVPLHVVSEGGKALRSTVGFLCEIIDRLAPAPAPETKGEDHAK